MSAYITVDGGTTNTRVSLVKDMKVEDTLKFNVGARLGIDNKTILLDTIKSGIAEILKKNNIKEQEISKILVSGMLTSEFGIMKLDHIVTPAGIDELHNSMVEVTLDNISSVPFVFIRGVKTPCNSIDDADMMRGEECELIGLSDEIMENAVYILPGSHSKLLRTDIDGKITDITTMLTGEMIAAISQGTILKDAIDFENSEIDDKYLLMGYEYCEENGFNKSVFKTRVLKNMFSKSKSEVYSFFMGVLLCDEIREIIKLNPEIIIIGGKKQIKEATYKILLEKSKSKISCVDDKIADVANSLGMIKIFER